MKHIFCSKYDMKKYSTWELDSLKINRMKYRMKLLPTNKQTQKTKKNLSAIFSGLFFKFESNMVV